VIFNLRNHTPGFFGGPIERPMAGLFRIVKKCANLIAAKNFLKKN
jgi:hypothetical protein